MKKIIRLTESDLARIVKRVLMEILNGGMVGRLTEIILMEKPPTQDLSMAQ